MDTASSLLSFLHGPVLNFSGEKEEPGYSVSFLIELQFCVLRMIYGKIKFFLFSNPNGN